ncbi:MAG TPA: hypothetical protein VLI42_02895, partial [Chthoniobacterales bacterium]|nr:hypothetical protein [Chthoniobacterales bacterium]
FPKLCWSASWRLNGWCFPRNMGLIGPDRRGAAEPGPTSVFKYRKGPASQSILMWAKVGTQR